MHPDVSHPGGEDEVEVVDLRAVQMSLESMEQSVHDLTATDRGADSDYRADRPIGSKRLWRVPVPTTGTRDARTEWVTILIAGCRIGDGLPH
jgi:hypothetical protein